MEKASADDKAIVEQPGGGIKIMIGICFLEVKSRCFAGEV